jgi:hypothetical protein
MSTASIHDRINKNPNLPLPLPLPETRSDEIIGRTRLIPRRVHFCPIVQLVTLGLLGKGKDKGKFDPQLM